MRDLLRETTFGQIVHWLSRGRLLQYRDQEPGYRVPERYLKGVAASTSSQISSRVQTPVRQLSIEKTPEEKRSNPGDEANGTERPPVNHGTVDATPLADPASLEAQKPADEKEKEVDPNIVDWDGDDDPDNPQNWSLRKRAFVQFQICILTFSVYIGGAIYTTSIPDIMETFHVSYVVGTLGLSLYVLAYGIGPMFLSPLQEIPLWGRNPIYMSTQFIFVVLQVPTALAPNIGSLLVLRFLAGFFASPALATGGATISDIFPMTAVPYMIGLWVMCAIAGPVLGPIVGGFAAQAKGWTWPIWELLWISGFSLVFLFFFLPETLADNILLRKARRLRKLTGNPNLKSMSEIKQAAMTPKGIATEYLVRPFQLMMEPAVFFINLYVALTYAIFYLWFEAFPLVFGDIYHFNLGLSGLAFLGIVVGALFSYIVYALYLYYYLNPKFVRQGFLEPEERLTLAIPASIMIPISLFIFGWTSRENVHWIAPIIGAGIYMPGVYLFFQSALVYIPLSYPNYAASLLAGNDFFRSTAGAAFPLFGRAFFKNLGLGPGSSLLAGLALIMIPFLWLLKMKGAKLRSMSKYATA